MVCLDIGANIGTVTTHLARRVGEKGRVFAFEPMPHIIERLLQHVRRNEFEAIVHVEAVALSDRFGEAAITCAGFDVPNQGMASLVMRQFLGRYVTISVPTQTLDRFVLDHAALSRIDLVKIDIQGSELSFLSGARQTLVTRCPTLLLEVAPRDLAALGKTSKDLVEAVEVLGYDVYELLPDGRTAYDQPVRATDIPRDYSSSAVVCVHRNTPRLP
jgi:FkbM family methyltransferase